MYNMPDGLRRAQTTKLRMNTVTAAENLTDISYLKVCKLLKAPLKTLNKHKTRVPKTKWFTRAERLSGTVPLTQM